MSVIGIDIGNENCYIAVARAGGIETIANEYSQRATPTYVAFGDKTRDLGVSAKNKQITNLKNTIYCFKRMIGQIFMDEAISHERFYVPFDVCELPNKEAGFEVSYLGEKTVFTCQQIMAMMLTKLKEISEANLRIKVQDCVVSVPVYYTDAERRALLDSAEIAGLNVLRLMNEPTAVALAYGFYRQDLSEDKPKNVVFVDLGQSALQVTACAFTKGKLKVLGTVWDRFLGGRDFDTVLAQHFMFHFNDIYGMDVIKNKKAVIRLMTECEKLKKQMSANSLELPLNIECFIDDKDVSGRMKREDFEDLASRHLAKIESIFRRLLEETRLKLDDIDSVQIVGGSTRLPCVKLLVQKVFGREPSTTLNQDEAVARGCALQCAMLSPTFKVKNFSITDIQPYPIKLLWKSPTTLDGIEENEMEVFPYMHPVPFSKLLSFYRPDTLHLDIHYMGGTCHSHKPNAKIGRFSVENIKPRANGDSPRIKVKARINIHGIFSICSATMLDRQPVVANNQDSNVQKTDKNPASPKESKEKSDDAMDAENVNASPNGDISNAPEENEEKSCENQDDEKAEAERQSLKYVVKTIELPIVAQVPRLSRSELDDLIEKEAKMIMQDKMEKEKADAKNAVEEYVYEMRGKLSGELEKFISEEEGNKFKKFLEETESWLYDKGEDQQKSVYIQRLNDLKKYGEPVISRCTEWEQRPLALNEIGRSLQLVHKAIQSYKAKEEQYSHIEEDDMMKVNKLWEEKDQWLGQYLGTLSKLQQHEDPPITAAQINQEKENFENQVKPILSKPKPKVEPPADEKSSDNIESQTDSEMQDTSNVCEKGDKQEQVADDQPSSQSQPENMETN